MNIDAYAVILITVFSVIIYIGTLFVGFGLLKTLFKDNTIGRYGRIMFRVVNLLPVINTIFWALMAISIILIILMHAIKKELKDFLE